MLHRWINALRRNHGLEHATVAVLTQRFGLSRLAGRASSDGFFILADVDPQDLDASAREALRLMQGGHHGLAVSPMCGTNLAVTGMLTATAAAAVLSTGTTRQRLPNAFLAATLATVASPLVGRWIQRHLTTRGDVDRVEIVGTKRIAGPLKKVQTRGAAY